MMEWLKDFDLSDLFKIRDACAILISYGCGDQALMDAVELEILTRG